MPLPPIGNEHAAAARVLCPFQADSLGRRWGDRLAFTSQAEAYVVVSIIHQQSTLLASHVHRLPTHVCACIIIRVDGCYLIMVRVLALLVHWD